MGASTVNKDYRLYDQGVVPIETSGWLAGQSATRRYPVLQQAISTDVVVVGAGLAGSSLALHLAERGVGVAVLEARQPGWGASGRNAGHVLPMLKDLRVLQRFPDAGQAFLEAFREHHDIPFTLSRRLQIDCDASASGYLHAMQGRKSFEGFSQTCRAQAQSLGQTLRTLGADEMFAMTGSRRYSQGVLHEAGGRINPYLFTQGLIANAEHQGAAVYGGSEVLRLTSLGGRWLVETAQGQVSCERVVFCTNAYATGVVPELAHACYPLTAYALSTKPLPQALREVIMPSQATLAQVPVDLNPLVVDGRGRLITASIPSCRLPHNAQWHFQQHLRWIERTWPQAKGQNIELEHYWTGRVALRDQEFPGVYEVRPGVYGLMHFNAWGNVMAPLMGMLLAHALAEDRPDRLPCPINRPKKVWAEGRKSLLIRRLLIPAARAAQRLGVI